MRIQVNVDDVEKSIYRLCLCVRHSRTSNFGSSLKLWNLDAVRRGMVISSCMPVNQVATFPFMQTLQKGRGSQD
jgi:hypothetical protein